MIISLTENELRTVSIALTGLVKHSMHRRLDPLTQRRRVDLLGRLKRLSKCDSGQAQRTRVDRI